MKPRVETITSSQVGDSYYRIQHPTGLTILLYPQRALQHSVRHVWRPLRFH